MFLNSCLPPSPPPPTFVCPFPLDGPRLPFLSIVLPSAPPPADTHPCLSHITSTSITAHLHHCMHILSRFSLHPPCRSQSHIVISLSLCILSFPPPGLSTSHPSLTLCICYMILHRPAVCGHSYGPFGYLKPPEKPLAYFVVRVDLISRVYRTATSRHIPISKGLRRLSHCLWLDLLDQVLQ